MNSGVMESLLQVLDWRAVQPMNITVNTCTCGCERNGTCTCTCIIITVSTCTCNMYIVQDTYMYVNKMSP